MIFSQNFQIDQGADFSWTSPPYMVGGVVQDLTGAHARMMLRRRPSSMRPNVSITDTVTAYGSVVPNGTLGTVTVTLTKLATSGLEPGMYDYDCFVDLPPTCGPVTSSGTSPPALTISGTPAPGVTGVEIDITSS